MLTDYLQQKLKSAKYKILKDGTFYASIRGLPGVWSNARTLERCRSELQEVLEDWILLKVRDRENITGLAIRFDRRRLIRS